MVDKVYIFEERLKNAGSTGDFVHDMHLGEAMHRLNESAPELYERLRNAAENDPKIQEWKQNSFKVVTGRMPDETGKVIPEERRETRDIDKWWRESRFDQVLGGYVFGGPDANLHTLRSEGWSKNSPKWGSVFRKEAEAFRQSLGKDKRSPLALKIKNYVPRASPEEEAALQMTRPYDANSGRWGETRDFDRGKGKKRGLLDKVKNNGR